MSLQRLPCSFRFVPDASSDERCRPEVGSFGVRGSGLMGSRVENDVGVDRAEVMEFARNTIRDAVDPRAAVTAVIRRCADAVPDPAWATIERIDLGASWQREQQWFVDLLRSDPPGPEVTGLWFGVFNAEYDDGIVVSDFYVAGSPTFGADPEWMCSLDWWPDGRYATSEAQAQIYRIASTSAGSVLEIADYVLTFTHAALTARRLVELPEAVDRLAAGRTLGVGVGHDSGDAILIGEITSTGFERGDCDWI